MNWIHLVSLPRLQRPEVAEGLVTHQPESPHLRASKIKPSLDLDPAIGDYRRNRSEAHGPGTC
jgi:hypothetical protein